MNVFSIFVGFATRTRDEGSISQPEQGSPNLTLSFFSQRQAGSTSYNFTFVNCVARGMLHTILSQERGEGRIPQGLGRYGMIVTLTKIFTQTVFYL